MIPTLPDPEALRLLTLIARATPPTAPPPTPALLTALTTAFGPPPAGPPPTDGALARAALALLAENPAGADQIDYLLDNPTRSATLGVGAALTALTAALAILQTHVRVERTPAGEWTFTAEKKPATEALTTLAHLVSRALGATLAPTREIDVLIITAIPLEYDAVLSVSTGAAPSTTWQTRPGPTGFDLAFRTFLTATNRPLRIAVTRPLTMGATATAAAAAPLVTAYRPLCLAMCGVCAGRRGHVNLGDVIIADTLWTYDTGALVAETASDGRTVERFKADPLTYNLSAAWKHRADTYHPAPPSPWIHDRPRAHQNQTDWLLALLHAGDDPIPHPDRKTRCADYTTLVPLLRARGLLEPTGLRLTAAGRATIEDRLLLHPDGLPEPAPFDVHVGPIGTGTNLVRDPHIFDRLSERQRKVLGLEMEAAAIGAVAHLHDVEHALVMKGVMDHADLDKSDAYKPFAARASAECLIAFLRDNLEP